MLRLFCEEQSYEKVNFYKKYFYVNFASNFKNQRKMSVTHVPPIKVLKEKQQNKEKHKDNI